MFSIESITSALSSSKHQKSEKTTPNGSSFPQTGRRLSPGVVARPAGTKPPPWATPSAPSVPPPGVWVAPGALQPPRRVTETRDSRSWWWQRCPHVWRVRGGDSRGWQGTPGWRGVPHGLGVGVTLRGAPRCWARIARIKKHNKIKIKKKKRTRGGGSPNNAFFPSSCFLEASELFLLKFPKNVRLREPPSLRNFSPSGRGLAE